MSFFTLEGAGDPSLVGLVGRRRRGYIGLERFNLGSVSNGLGYFMCQEGDCVAGAARVTELQETFKRTGSPARFRVAVETLVKSFQEINASWARRFVPWAPQCCTIKDLGDRAALLTNEMLMAAGQYAPPPPPSPPIPIETLFKWTIIAALGTGAAILLYKGASLGSAATAYAAVAKRATKATSEQEPRPIAKQIHPEKSRYQGKPTKKSPRGKRREKKAA